MKTFTTFYIKPVSFSLHERKVIFSYSFDDYTSFKEEILLPEEFTIRRDFDTAIAENILFHASIAFGMSYYKLYPTQKIIIESGSISEDQTLFWRDFYISGLWEFFYTNNIDFQNLAYFESSSQKLLKKIDFTLDDSILLPIWWWKDSIVSALLLHEKKSKITPYIFGKSDYIKENFLKIYNKDGLLVKRALDPQLFEMNKQGYYNGHVPITGLISFITFFIAYIYNFREIIFSNEKSANIGNTIFHGEEINHQYSKSEEFEQKISKYLEDYVSSDMQYYSLLRKYYEIEIAKKFSELWKEYFSEFSSCNKNFSITKGLQKSKWCCKCPKCLFVYMILRPFISKEENKIIFWKELYEDETLEELFYETVWYSWIKPFECVWETSEAELAVFLQYEKWEWKDLPYLLTVFKKKILSIKTEQYFIDLKKRYFINL